MTILLANQRFGVTFSGSLDKYLLWDFEHNRILFAHKDKTVIDNLCNSHNLHPLKLTETC